jgi:hypothetical protein
VVNAENDVLTGFITCWSSQHSNMNAAGLMIMKKHWIAESFIMIISLDLLRSDKAAAAAASSRLELSPMMPRLVFFFTPQR